MKKTILSTVVLTMMLMACGGQKTSNEETKEEGDSLFWVISTSKDTARVMFLTDSLVDIGDLSFWGGAIVKSEFYNTPNEYPKRLEILKDAIQHDKPQNLLDSVAYYNCVTILANDMMLHYRNEEALKLALSAVEPLEAVVKDSTNNDFSCFDLLLQLYEVISQSQMTLGMHEEAEKSFEESYKQAILSTKVLNNKIGVSRAAILTFNTILRYTERKEYAKAEKWLHRQDSLTNVLLTLDDAEEEMKDYFSSLYAYNHAIVALGLNRKAEAEEAFNAYQKTQFAMTDEGRINGSDYLQGSGRLDEAADALTGMEDFYVNQGKELSLEILSKLAEKFRLYHKIGRKDGALATANFICEHLDSAIHRQNEGNMAEMATIYETQKKDAEIAQQQIKLTQQRVIGLIIAIVLLTIFFIIYTLVRRRAAKRLAEMKAAQERIESELRIARDIQMSMVPSSFPDYDGLDMYASMTPAKEVGGDLYGYVLLGDKLYFALGDVSGKGVPASLFMAQATRLFRTLAVQQMKPAEICTRMNEALSGEDNENGMFVTFFLGLIDLTTGHLDFCNAGHNPPVIGGGEHLADFLEMIPNAPIGLFPGLDYEGEEIDNIKGRPLFIYTDGLNEAENKAQEQFGDDKLLEILRGTTFESAQQVIDVLKAEVEQHRHGAEPNDDLTMLCMRVNC